MVKAKFKTRRGRPTKGERQVQITFRLSPSLKLLAEHMAQTENRSFANFIASLIRDRCQAGFGRPPAEVPEFGSRGS